MCLSSRDWKQAKKDEGVPILEEEFQEPTPLIPVCLTKLT